MQIVAITPNQWNGQWMNRQHLMWAMKDFCSVLYVQEPLPWHKGAAPRDETFFFGRSARDVSGLTVLRLPKCLARSSSRKVWNRIMCRRKASLIQRTTDTVTRPRVLYLWDPKLFEYVECLEADLVVYHVFDVLPAWISDEDKDESARRRFLRACDMADLVITGTSQQAEVVPHGRTAVVPNGVSWEMYSRSHDTPKYAANIPSPRIGYVGTISSKVDLDWLEAIAAECTWQLVLVGPLRIADQVNRRRMDALLGRENVHYLGYKDPHEIPAYMKMLNVGLMCYSRGLHCELASPLKLYEYAAVGIPIVSSRLDSLVATDSLESIVTLVDTPEQAVDAIHEALSLAPDLEGRGKRISFAARNTWKDRASTIQGLINESLTRKYRKNPRSHESD